MQSTTETSVATPKTLNFEFRGEGMEYFKIWIVNILLTIVTLGIYSAWATVRNNRYFYSNLYLDGSNFRYLAEPLTILKGRIIAVVAFIIYSVVANLFPMVGIGLLILLFFATPYFVNKSMAFKNRMSSYKNIQFRFSASYGEAFMVLYVWPILGILTLGILYPMAILKLHKYQIKNSAYGTAKFNFEAGYKDYGLIFLTMLGIGLMVGLPAWAIGIYAPSIGFLSPILIAIMYIGLNLFFIVQSTNLYYKSMSLVKHTFTSTLSIPSLGWVMLVNLFLTIITIGLYLPAAKVRMTKYICSCLVMNATDSLDNFAAAEQENISAIGEEFGQVFDFGI